MQMDSDQDNRSRQALATRRWYSSMHWYRQERPDAGVYQGMRVVAIEGAHASSRGRSEDREEKTSQVEPLARFPCSPSAGTTAGVGDPHARRFGIQGERRAGRIGIWVTGPSGDEAKIAALGVRIRRWVSFHGVSINLDPELEHFSGIVPCGIQGFGVTSLTDLGLTTSMPELDAALMAKFEQVFPPPT